MISSHGRGKKRRPEVGLISDLSTKEKTPSPRAEVTHSQQKTMHFVKRTSITTSLADVVWAQNLAEREWGMPGIA